LKFLRVAWAAPWSLVGLILSPSFERRRIYRGALLCEGARWPRRLGWKYRAITFGHVVLCVDEADDRLMDHELVHVDQYGRWGPFFIPAYLVAGAWAMLKGHKAYRDNHFEVAAVRDSSVPPERGR
jgi:hypothetical protein